MYRIVVSASCNMLGVHWNGYDLLTDLHTLAQTERPYCQDLALINPGLPDNFAEVVKGVYRSSFPLAENLEALKELGLMTIL